MPHLAEEDNVGRVQLYDTLKERLQKKGLRDRELLRATYQVALQLAEPERLTEARTMMVETSPAWALSEFRDVKDAAGIDYAVQQISARHGVGTTTLTSLIEKYQRR